MWVHVGAARPVAHEIDVANRGLVQGQGHLDTHHTLERVVEASLDDRSSLARPKIEKYIGTSYLAWCEHPA
jgi:hypothetical protein